MPLAPTPNPRLDPKITRFYVPANNEIVPTDRIVVMAQ